jgi:crotonobetainyl-CoA:carnitine CoA-transferase CaiB-like acyl-CoA transferase
VFVTNYRSEALARMGLAYEDVAAANPRLVYARVSGFGPLGPDADKAMLDGAAQARSGLAAISGPPDGPPMPPGAAVADHTGAMQLALGIMTALYARERTGRGQEVNTSALGAMMWIQSWEITHTTMSDEPLRREGQHNPNIRCPYGVYETKDGGAFLLAVAMSDESWDDFWLFVDRPEVLVDPRWNNVAKRIGARGTVDGVADIRRHVREAFATKTTAEWTAFLATQPEIIVERIQSYEELLEDPQVTANGYLAEVDVPNFGPARVVSNVVHLSHTPGSGVRRAPPLLGEHTAEVMAELGFGDAEIDEVLTSVAGSAEQIVAAIFDD